MDKYEFNMKIDKIKGLVEEKDFATAQKIVDTIQWDRVRSASLLTLAATVDEENGRLDDARDKLVMALDRAPVGKRILYKLTELAVRSGKVEEAEDYYEEFRNLAPEDPAGLLLQYMIMKVKHEPYSQLIACLELYNQYDTDEKWMYELATTYEAAGRVPDLIALCDRIALMFGGSTYGVKALKLKAKYGKLTDEQRAILYPNSIASSGVHYAKDDPGYAIRMQNEEMEKQESEGDRLAANRIENEDDLFRVYAMTHDPSGREPVPVREEPAERIVSEEISKEAVRAAAAEAAAAAAEAAAEEYAGPEEEEEQPEIGASYRTSAFEKALKVAEASAAKRAVESAVEEMVQETAQEEFAAAEVIAEEAPEIVQEAVEATAEKIAEAIAPESAVDPDGEIFKADARIMAAELEKAAVAVEKAAVEPAPAPRPVERVPEPRKITAAEAPIERRNMIIEADDDQVGLDIAIGELKQFHAEFGASNGAIKIAAEKLNETGLTRAVLAKIRGKDFVIEHAGELAPELTDDLYDLMLDDTDGTTVVLIDNPEGLDKLEEMNKELLDTCDYISDLDYSDSETEEEIRTAPVREPVKEPVSDDNAPDEEYEDEEEEIVEEKEDIRIRPAKKKDVSGDEMSVDDFVEYCDQYATDIDCVMDADARLALYQRVELMEEDGIPLTKKSAEELMEATADLAEHPKSLARKFKKYDKNSNLIIKEEDFLPKGR